MKVTDTFCGYCHTTSRDPCERWHPPDPQKIPLKSCQCCAGTPFYLIDMTYTMHWLQKERRAWLMSVSRPIIRDGFQEPWRVSKIWKRALTPYPLLWKSAADWQTNTLCEQTPYVMDTSKLREELRDIHPAHDVVTWLAVVWPIGEGSHHSKFEVSIDLDHKIGMIFWS